MTTSMPVRENVACALVVKSDPLPVITVKITQKLVPVQNHNSRVDTRAYTITLTSLVTSSATNCTHKNKKQKQKQC